MPRPSAAHRQRNLTPTHTTLPQGACSQGSSSAPRTWEGEGRDGGIETWERGNQEARERGTRENSQARPQQMGRTESQRETHPGAGHSTSRQDHVLPHPSTLSHQPQGSSEHLSEITPLLYTEPCHGSHLPPGTGSHRSPHPPGPMRSTKRLGQHQCREP